MKAARAHGIVETCAELDLEVLADKGYQGAGGTVTTPIKRRANTELSDKPKASNRVHAALRAPVQPSADHRPPSRQDEKRADPGQWNPAHPQRHATARLTRQQCTTAKRGFRTLSIYPEPGLRDTLNGARHTQQQPDWEVKYALRTGIKGTVNQALDVTGLRHARYRGLAKTRLQHAFSATALNIIRLDAHWHDPPLHTTRSSRLARLTTRLTT